jgi:hypothetical protein
MHIRQCDHEECQDHWLCRYPSLAERRDDFWIRYRAGLPVGGTGTDPIAWLDGLFED